MKKKLIWGTIIFVLLLIGGIFYVLKMRLLATVNLILDQTTHGHVEMKAGNLVIDFYNKEIDLRNLKIQAYLDSSRTNALFINCKELNVSLSEFSKMMNGSEAILNNIEIVEPRVKLILIKEKKPLNTLELPKMIERLKSSVLLKQIPEQLRITNGSVLIRNKNGVQYLNGINGMLYGNLKHPCGRQDCNYLHIKNVYLKNKQKSNWMIAKNISIDSKVSIRIQQFGFKSNDKSSAIDSIYLTDGYFNLHSYFATQSLGNVQIDTTSLSSIFAIVNKKYAIEEISSKEQSKNAASALVQTVLLRHATFNK